MKARRQSGQQLSFDLDSPRTVNPETKPPSSEQESEPESPSFSAPAATPRRAPAGPVVLTVSALTRQIKSLLEAQIGSVWIRGEISNLSRPPSGHLYFTLKDETSCIPCVLFAGDARLVCIPLENGQAVRVFGDLTVYERRGYYQIVVRLVQSEGEGVLQARFEALKRKLEAEGLFAPGRKRPIPRHINCIGVVTSSTGAALRDFLRVLWRRDAGIRVLLAHSRVQGEGAAEEIVAAIRLLNRLEPPNRPEVIVLTRGGGSIEDLWEFNEEIVARAIVASELPVISAIGHEVDFTIADFAADLRASTPSVAAELLSQESVALREAVRDAAVRMRRICVRELQIRREQVRRAGAAFRNPERLLREYIFELDRASQLLRDIANARLRLLDSKFQNFRMGIRRHHPVRYLHELRTRLSDRSARMQTAMHSLARRLSERLEAKENVLRAFDPALTLQRGFTLTYDGDGNLLKSTESARAAASLRTRFADGEVISRPVSEDCKSV